MSQFYNITQYSEGNAYESKYGTLQSFFLDIEGIEGTIMTNKKPGNTPKLGQVYGDLVDTGKTGKKGQKIYQFKQQQMPDGMSTPANTTAPVVAGGSPSPAGMPEWFAPYAVMIKQIHEQNVLKDEDINPTTDATDTTESDDIIPGTKLSKSELEDIFGGSMEPIEIDDK